MKVKVTDKFASVCVERGRNISTFTGIAEPLKRGFEEVRAFYSALPPVKAG